jgi:D-alanine-D-alanine ligase
MKIGILYNLVDRIERGLEIDKLSDNEIAETAGHVKKALEGEHEAIPVRISKDILAKLNVELFDFVFNLCEGVGGNVRGESWVPAILDIIGIPYTGSDSLTLGLCLDKVKTKQLLFANSIPTPSYQIFRDLLQTLNPELSFPLIVKPANEDASVGITIDSVVENKSSLFKMVEFVLKNYRQPALVEEYIDGRELNVAILGNGKSLEVLPISEIRFDFDKKIPKILSYDAKWIPESEMFKKTVGVCPPAEKLPEDVEARIKKLAVAAYNLTQCRDYARVDFRLNGDLPYVLEVNPNPGINKDSGFVRSALASGLSYDELIRKILSSAMKRCKIS